MCYFYHVKDWRLEVSPCQDIVSLFVSLLYTATYNVLSCILSSLDCPWQKELRALVNYPSVSMASPAG